MIFNITVADEDNDGRNGQIDPKELPLTEEQTVRINELFDDCAEVGMPLTLERKTKEGTTTDFALFWGWLGIKDMHDAKGKHFDKMVDYLERRKKTALEKKGGKK